MTNKRKKLIEAEQKALRLFDWIESTGLIQSGRSEREISNDIFLKANELFNLERYWHKRIVRAGVNTVCPYDDNPSDRIIEEDDIVFIDLGPVFEDWEADIGRTYVVGDCAQKRKIAEDAESLWYAAQKKLLETPSITSKELFLYVADFADKAGWCFGGPIAGHLIGKFPHENISPEKIYNYIHPENNEVIDKSVNWIIEIHLVNKERSYGAFFEQLAL